MPTADRFASLPDLADQLERTGVGQTITLDIRRGSRPLTISVEMADISAPQ